MGMKRLCEIDCTREEAQKITTNYGRYKFYSAECGGWIPTDVIQIMFFKVIELEARIEQLEADRKRYQD